MKKYKLLALALSCAFGFGGCSVSIPDAAPFSYEQVTERYKESEPGVKYNDFQNTSPTEITTAKQAVDRAKNECKIDYNKIDVGFDEVTDMWRIGFSNEGVFGVWIDLYMDKICVTKLIVAGE